MDSQRIAEIKAREKASTPGPWRYSDVACEIWNEDGDTVVGGVDSEEVSISDTDTAFIAHARTDIPALLAEVERLNVIAEQRYQLYDGALTTIATLKKALELATEETVETLHKLDKCGIIQITNDGTAEELADYYIQQAKQEARNE